MARTRRRAVRREEDVDEKGARWVARERCATRARWMTRTIARAATEGADVVGYILVLVRAHLDDDDGDDETRGLTRAMRDAAIVAYFT